MLDILTNAAIFFATVALMEGVANFTHKYVMHGWLWVLHESHHRPRTGTFELNDLFAVFFSLPSILLIYIGTYSYGPALWVGLGILTYGLIYFIFHDVIVHKRLSFPYKFKGDYMLRIIQAHKLHHAVSTKEGAVSFGFLYASAARDLKAELKKNAGEQLSS